jgi:hypothetical protein
LNSKVLTDAFAQIGVVCAVLKPEPNELDSFSETLCKIAGNSDVIVLDWVLHEFKQGEKTLQLIEALLKGGRPDGGRARLIVIYTGETNLDFIAQSVRTVLKVDPATAADPFTIQRGAVRVAIYAKEAARLGQAEKARAIKGTDLPEIVVSEFAHLTRGLVSNVAIKSMAALRSNTYQLLRRFHAKLDAPFVTHKTLLAPDEASGQLIPLIVSEIQAVLEDERVAEVASHKRVGQWLKYQIRRGLQFDPVQHTTEREYGLGLSFLIGHGASKHALTALFAKHRKCAEGVFKSVEKAPSRICDHLTRILTLEAERESVKDSELALLMSVRSRYGSPPPRLSLGTIVCETKGEVSQYLLCVQPRCDSVRLTGKRAFPFLPLREAADGPCQLLVEDKGKLVRLRLKDTPCEARMITFAPSSSKEREVLARFVGSDRCFRVPRSKVQYRWVADLKPEHAQRVANNYASKISRVGLTESEWMRLMRGKLE